MTFETIRLILILTGVAVETDIDDFKVVIYHEDKMRNINLSKTMFYRDIPNCFNCIVHEFDIDLDNKKIWVKSEVAKHGKI